MGLYDEFNHGKLSLQTKALGQGHRSFQMLDEVGFGDSRPSLYQVNSSGSDGYWILISRDRITGYSKQGFNVYTIFYDYPTSKIIHLPYAGVPFRLGY